MSTAGYSGTPLPRKLGIREGSRVLLAGAPAGFGEALQPAGGVWVAWPKRSSGVATELTETVVRELGLAAGLVDNKVRAIDATWSALRFVWRLRDRPPRP